MTAVKGTESHSRLSPQDERRLAVLNGVLDVVFASDRQMTVGIKPSEVQALADWVLQGTHPAPEEPAAQSYFDKVLARCEPVLSAAEMVSMRKPPAAATATSAQTRREWVAGDIVRLNEPSENATVAALGQEGWQVTRMPFSDDVMLASGKLWLRHPDLPWGLRRLPAEVTLTGHIAGGTS